MVSTTSVVRPESIICAPSEATPMVYIIPGVDAKLCCPPESEAPTEGH